MAGYPGQFGNVLIKKESFDKFINTMVGVPVIINHKDINKDNANDERVGVVSDVWFDDKDGWYWCDGVIWDETAQNLITDKGWSVSCSYDVKLADDKGGTENNIPYDIEFLDGVFTHLAIVDNPRYERANIVFNSKTIVNNDMTNICIQNAKIIKGLSEIIANINIANFTNNDIRILKGLVTILDRTSVNNGWITLKDKVDEDGKPLRIFIPNYIPSGGAAIDFHHKMATQGKDTTVIYEFKQTKANISEEQKHYIKQKVEKILSSFKVKPPLKGVNVCTIGGGCLGVAVASAKTRTLSLDSKIFKEKRNDAFNKSVESGWLARTGKDVLTSVLTHELGHIITAGSDKESFWSKIKEIKSEYTKNIKEEDINHPDYVSKYARKNKDEFVAECFAQATLLKTPSKYAKMVLDEINTHFKISANESKKLRLFNAIMEVLELKNDLNVENKKDNSNDEITWIEGEGIGYCLTEEEYNERKKEVDKYIQRETGN